METEPLIQDPVAVLAVFLLVLGVLFTANRHPVFSKIFRFVPLLVFAYFVPTILSNTGIIPLSSPLYGFIKTWLLPASLVLLTLSVDIPTIVKLGPKVGLIFLIATISIVLGGPLAYLCLGWMIPPEIADQAWRGLAALSGSWIGGGANFVAIGENFDVTESTFAMMAVIDVGVANIWTAILLWFAVHNEAMDHKIGADRKSIEHVQEKIKDFHKEVDRPTNLPDLLVMLAIAFGGTVIANIAGKGIFEWTQANWPEFAKSIKTFTYVVIIVTTIGLTISFTKLRKLEGAGASSVGSLFLYLLIARIGAQSDFAEVFKNLPILAVGALWMLFHAVILLSVRRFMKAPIFFMAVGSQANVGGAASAPVVAAAFHPSLATVGILLGVAGYVVGTYAGLLCGFLLQWAHGIVH